MALAQSKRQQILQLTPASEIVFEGPFDHVVTSYLELRNPSDKLVCFKVKTTAPRRYCVRPNCGIIEPDNKIKIAIMLQPIENDSQAERSKHKFMVQSTIVDHIPSKLEEVWKTIKNEDVMDSKLRCIFQHDKAESPTQKQPTPNATTEPATSTTAQNSNPWLSSTPTQSSSPVKHQSEGQQHSQKAKQIGGDTSQVNYSQMTSQSQKRPSIETASSHNLTASFLQPTNEDFKFIIVGLAMLFIGVILGKYII